MHPVLFKIGSFSVPTYGIAYFLGIMLTVILAVRRVEKEGRDLEDYLSCILLAIIGMLIMSKTLHILTNWDMYAANPKRFYNFRTGHVFYGGYIGSITFPLIYTVWKKIPFRPILDITATYMPLGLALHRAMGCFGAGCCYGCPTDVPWGVTFPTNAPASKAFGHVAVHPTQLYEAGFALLMFVALIVFREKWRKAPGQIFFLQIIIYGIGRFLIEFFRGDAERGVYGPMSTSQWISVIGIIAAIAAFYATGFFAKNGNPRQPASR